MKQINLQNKKCIPCEDGAKPLEKAAIDTLMKEIKAWTLLEDPKLGWRIQKNLKFIDFKHALSFINEIGDIAEFEGHHPNLNLHDWNQVTVTFYTHKIKGLSENDFVMAAKVDKLLEESEIK